MFKINKFLMGIGILLVIVLGVILAQISSLLYRYKRVQVFVTYAGELFLAITNKIIISWVILGILLFFLIIQFILEVKKK